MVDIWDQTSEVPVLFRVPWWFDALIAAVVICFFLVGLSRCSSSWC
jgi:hypothetical protein